LPFENRAGFVLWKLFTKLNNLQGKLHRADLQILMLHAAGNFAFCTLNSPFK